MNKCMMCKKIFADRKSCRKHLKEKHFILKSLRKNGSSKSELRDNANVKYKSEISLNCVRIINGKEIMTKRQKEYFKQ